MITIENLTWRNKVSDSLFELYEQALISGDRRPYSLFLDYQGDLRRLPDEIEVLSVIDSWIQVYVDMPQLPLLAEMKEVLLVSLPAKRQRELN